LLPCEPVLTEAAFLLRREGREADPLFALLERGVIRIALNVQEEQADLRALIKWLDSDGAMKLVLNDGTR
jgi:hypothetical protein